MIYRESRTLTKSFAEDRRLIPLAIDRWAIGALLLVLFVIVPLSASDYVLSAILIPILVLSLAALGLNIAVGYSGLLSLGTAGFMCFWAFTAFNLMLRIEWMNLILGVLLIGCGCRIGWDHIRFAQFATEKGSTYWCPTLAAQFFSSWFL